MPSPRSQTRDARDKAILPPVRVLIVNQSRISCQSLKSSLGRCCRKVFVTTCAVSRQELSTALETGDINVVLIDDGFQEGEESFTQILRSIHQESPETKLVGLLNHTDALSVVSAFRNGVRGVFHRSETVVSLCKCLRAVEEGQIWANSQDLTYVVEALYDSSRDGAIDPPEIALLTKRENQAARLVAEGNSNRAIAEKLGLTEHTVSNYLFRIYNKLGISTRVELVLYSFSQKREP